MFLSKKGPKEDERVARGHFHEYNGYLQALDLPQYLLPFPETSHFKIPWGATQFLFSKFYGLLKLIFHTNQYNAWYIVLYAEKAWNKRMIINFDIWSTVVIMVIMFAMVNMVARSSKSPIVS